MLVLLFSAVQTTAQDTVLLSICNLTTNLLTWLPYYLSHWSRQYQVESTKWYHEYASYAIIVPLHVHVHVHVCIACDGACIQAHVACIHLAS